MYPHLKEIELKLTNGCTEPVRGKLETEEIVIAKLLNNEQGNLTLVNEYICYKIASALNLPVIKSGICICDENTNDDNKCAKSENYGPCFYSIYLEKSSILKIGIIKLLSNLDAFYGILLFDHIVYNRDRNIYNLLTTYNKKDKKVRIIDHSHVFKNETLWDANCFKFSIEDFDIKDTCILESNKEMYGMFLRNMKFEKEKLYEQIGIFQKTINKGMLDKIISEIPQEWGLSKIDADALVEYLLYRLKHIDVICEMICRNIHTI